MPVLVCFEGHLVTQPAVTNVENSTCEAVAVSKQYRHEIPTEKLTGTRYRIRAEGDLANSLAAIDEGAGVVVIGHVQTTRWTDGAGRRRYDDVVVVDSIGVTMPPAG